MELVKPQVEVKMKHSELAAFEFQEAIQKIAVANLDNKTACKVRRVIKEVQTAINSMGEGYKKEIMETYAKRDAEGKVVPSPDGNPNSFAFDESKEAEFVKAQEDYGKKEVVLKATPFVVDDFKDIRLSAKNLNALGNLFVDDQVAV